MRTALLCFTLVAGCAGVRDALPPPVASRSEMPAAVQAYPEQSAADIIRRAHAAAGGEVWVHPDSLKLTGYNLIRAKDGDVLWNPYSMWRIYADEKTDLHAAGGKVRIEAWTGGKLAFLLAFDGVQTSNQDGVMTDQSANATWGENFGYGAIRNALDEGWSQVRLPDDLVDGAPAFMVELTDPSGGVTRFGIRQSDDAVVYVGFDTPRGWHERRYSNFFTKPGISWVQPGRVRLFYDGVKSNEAIWTDFQVGEKFDDSLFTITEAPAALTP